MKQKQKRNSTPVQNSEQPWVDCPDAWSKQFVEVIDYYSMLEAQNPDKAVLHSPSPDGYPKYLDRENDPYCSLKSPNPPTPEAVAKAQFVDKTYKWVGK
jgi:hypothetical protein